MQQQKHSALLAAICKSNPWGLNHHYCIPRLHDACMHVIPDWLVALLTCFWNTCRIKIETQLYGTHDRTCAIGQDCAHCRCCAVIQQICAKTTQYDSCVCIIWSRNIEYWRPQATAIDATTHKTMMNLRCLEVTTNYNSICAVSLYLDFTDGNFRWILCFLNELANWMNNYIDAMWLYPFTYQHYWCLLQWEFPAWYTTVFLSCSCFEMQSAVAHKHTLKPCIAALVLQLYLFRLQWR